MKLQNYMCTTIFICTEKYVTYAYDDPRLPSRLSMDLLRTWARAIQSVPDTTRSLGIQQGTIVSLSYRAHMVGFVWALFGKKKMCQKKSHAS